MGLITLAETIADASGGYAVGAFNVSELNQAVAVLEAARSEHSPVIVQVIAGTSAYRDENWWWDGLRQLIESHPDLTVTLHLDHGRIPEDCQRAIEHGFTSVMIDASRSITDDQPNSLDTNIALTSAVVDFAHPNGVSVEGELGTIGGAEGGHAGIPEEILFADPDEAQTFVARTGVDALAVAVGTSHGSVKFTDEAAGQQLRIGPIAEVKRRLPHTGPVLHGSSSIPADAIGSINAHRGQLPSSYGIDTAQKQEAIRHGIRKINQGTDSHLACTAALRTHLAEHPNEVEPGGAIAAAYRGMSTLIAQRMREFGSAGQVA